MNKLDIVFENDRMIIVNKPAGVLTQSSKSLEPDLTGMVMTYERSCGKEPYAAVINRLDRPVSGLVLFAKNKKEAARLSKMMQENTFDKQYMAVVCGKPDDAKGMFVDYLVKDGKSNISRAADKNDKDAKEAKLEYEVVERLSDEYTLVKIHLITGRHHQIRLQFALRGMPILGDTKYADSDNKKNEFPVKLKPREIALCACSLTIDNKKYEIKPDFL